MDCVPMDFNDIVRKALGYYVYALTDPRDGRIFYIGKGKGNRLFQHIRDASSSYGDDSSLKLDIIREIVAAGLGPGYYIIRHNLSEEEAFLVESTLIDVLTYPGFNTERVLANIVAGHHQWDEGIKSVEEINRIYDCPKIAVSPGERLFLVSLNRSYDQGMAEGVYIRKGIYEQTRKYWPVNIRRAEKSDFVLGVYKGIVRAVYKPVRWFPADVAEDGTVFRKTRYGFDGMEVPDSPYLNKDISDYPFGSGSSIAYVPRGKEDW